MVPLKGPPSDRVSPTAPSGKQSYRVSRQNRCRRNKHLMSPSPALVPSLCAKNSSLPWKEPHPGGLSCHQHKAGHPADLRTTHPVSDAKMSSPPPLQSSISCPSPLAHTELCHPTGRSLSSRSRAPRSAGDWRAEVPGRVTSLPGPNVYFSK